MRRRETQSHCTVFGMYILQDQRLLDLRPIELSKTPSLARANRIKNAQICTPGRTGGRSCRVDQSQYDGKPELGLRSIMLSVFLDFGRDRRSRTLEKACELNVPRFTRDVDLWTLSLALNFAVHPQPDRKVYLSH